MRRPGKIPGAGDFVNSRLPHALAGGERWLQQGMAAMRQRGADEIERHYTVAPVWNFLIPAGAGASCIQPPRAELRPGGALPGDRHAADACGRLLERAAGCCRHVLLAGRPGAARHDPPCTRARRSRADAGACAAHAGRRHVRRHRRRHAGAAAGTAGPGRVARAVRLLRSARRHQFLVDQPRGRIAAAHPCAYGHARQRAVPDAVRRG